MHAQNIRQVLFDSVIHLHRYTVDLTVHDLDVLSCVLVKNNIYNVKSTAQLDSMLYCVSVHGSSTDLLRDI